MYVILCVCVCVCVCVQHHLNTLDDEGNLGLNEDSILHYFIADQRREIGEWCVCVCECV